MGLEDQKTTGAESPDLKDLFGMRQLAISKAFELSVGRESYDDPAAVQQQLDELLAIRMQQRALLQSVIAKREEFDSAALREKNLSNEREDILHTSMLSLINLITNTEDPKDKPSLDGSELMDAEQNRLFSLEGAVLYDLAKCSGIIRMLNDDEIVENLTRVCGHQLSNEQLSLGDSLDNLEMGYSITPQLHSGEPKAFAVSGGSQKTAAPVLGRLLVGSLAGAEKGSLDDIFSSTAYGVSSLDFYRENLANLLAKPLGLKGQARGPALRTKVNPPELSGYSSSQWSKLDQPELSELSSELDELIFQAQNGDFVSDLLAAASPDRVDGFSQGVFGRKMPFFDPLRSALYEPLMSVLKKIQNIAAQNRQTRAMSWFDNVAGDRAGELVAKVWGRHATMATTFAEIEMVAGNAQNIWKSLEGQEALGLFSVRAAAGLGLSLSGRDLPERTKAKLKSAHGFTDGAWRLLGKLNANTGSPASNWAFRIGKFSLPSNQASMRAGSMATSSEALDGSIRIFGAALSAASAKGAGVEQTEELLSKLLAAQHKLIKSLAIPPAPPRLAEIPAADQLAEAEAFRAKAPLILTRMFDKALAEGWDRAWPALELVNDWISNAEWGIWRELPDNISWAEANRRQKEWHDMILRRERSEKESIVWDSLVGSSANPQTGFSSIPLTDGGMLWDEGKAMHHCVSSYAHTCLEGHSRIFGILKNGEHFGTLELELSDSGEWRNVQFNGKCNAVIDDERAIEFATQICDAYQAAHVAKMATATQPHQINNLAGKLAGMRHEPAAAVAARPADI